MTRISKVYIVLSSEWVNKYIGEISEEYISGDMYIDKEGEIRIRE